MQGFLAFDVTVNSVVGRWSIVLEDAPIEDSRGRNVGAVLKPLARRLFGSPVEERLTHVVDATAGFDGVLRLSGASRFHFLPPRRRYSFELLVDGNSEPLLRQEVETLAVGKDMPPKSSMILPDDTWRIYVGTEHELGDWLSACPTDFVLAFQPTAKLLWSLWLNACFTLPSPGSPICQCPNPRSRYCLDLTKDSRWLHGKKVRRHKGDFRLTVNGDFCETFRRCAALHRDQGSGTWITPELIEALDACRRERGEVKVYSIELWEKSTGALAAAIMGMSVGDIFHDYTMATLLRDSRSPGAILSKVVGQLLVDSGYTLWYWGFKNAYMAEYDEGYGGMLMDNQREFWPRWKVAQTCATPCDLEARVLPGLDNGIDLTTLCEKRHE